MYSRYFMIVFCMTTLLNNMLTANDHLVEEFSDEILQNPYCYHFEDTSLSDVPLELSDGVSEILTTLKGKLVLRLIPKDPEHPSLENYCWFLQLDEPSFIVASTTPVWGYALSFKEITQQSNWFEVQIGRDRKFEEFCYAHINQEVSLEGYLFHAHTGHHYAPFLMDVRRIY